MLCLCLLHSQSAWQMHVLCMQVTAVAGAIYSLRVLNHIKLIIYQGPKTKVVNNE